MLFSLFRDTRVIRGIEVEVNINISIPRILHLYRESHHRKMDFLLYLWVKRIVGGIRMGVHPLVHLRGKTSNAVQRHLIQPLRLLIIRLHHDVGNIVVVFATDEEK